MKQTSRREAKNDGRKAIEHNMRDVIFPDDVDETARSWHDIDEDTLNDEVWRAIEVMHQENRFRGEISEHAILYYLDGIPRLSMDKLAYDDKETALLDGGVWPNSMNFQTAYDLLWENQRVIPTDCWDWAREAVHQGVYEEYHPTTDG